MTILRNDILPDSLTQQEAKVIVKYHFDSIIESSRKNRPQDAAKSVTPGKAKDIYEFFELVKQVTEHRQVAMNVSEDSKVFMTQEFSEVEQHLETISFSVMKRQPGSFSEGAPFQGDVKNLRPILREVVDDVDNPGYRKVIQGYWYDNLVKFTCWAKTNKEANDRSLWLEQLIEDYTWFFRISGVSRVYFWERLADSVEDTTNSIKSTTNKYYGRSLVYYLRTEKITTLSEKELEQVIVNVHTSNK